MSTPAHAPRATPRRRHGFLLLVGIRHGNVNPHYGRAPRQFHARRGSDVAPCHNHDCRMSRDQEGRSRPDTRRSRHHPPRPGPMGTDHAIRVESPQRIPARAQLRPGRDRTSFQYHVRHLEQRRRDAHSSSRGNGSSPTRTARSSGSSAPGVVGEQPVLQPPGGSFEYTSYCPLKTSGRPRCRGATRWSIRPGASASTPSSRRLRSPSQTRELTRGRSPRHSIRSATSGSMRAARRAAGRRP